MNNTDDYVVVNLSIIKINHLVQGIEEVRDVAEEKQISSLRNTLHGSAFSFGQMRFLALVLLSLYCPNPVLDSASSWILQLLFSFLVSDTNFFLAIKQVLFLLRTFAIDLFSVKKNVHLAEK